MDLQRILLIGAIAVVGVLTLRQWTEDYNQARPKTVAEVTTTASSQNRSDIPVIHREKGISNTTTKPSPHLVSIKTDVFDIKIDQAGGDIVGLSLLEYPAWLPKKGENVQPFNLLVNNANCSGEKNCVYIAQSALVKTDGPDSNNERSLYSTEQKNIELLDGQDELTVSLRYHQAGVDIIKSYMFKRKSYEVQVTYEIANNSNVVWTDQFYAQLKRDGGGDPSEENSSAPINTYLGGAVHSLKKTYQKLPFDDIKKEKFDERILGGYAAILQHYFVGAWVADPNKEHNYYTNISHDGKHYFIGFYDDALTVNPGEVISTSAILYAGPKLQDNLKPLAEGLELTVDYGILWFLAQPLFVLLHWIQSIVGNWGWSIILLTVLVKAVFYPLNAASFRSMAKMRKLGPKMKSLKEQYGDDRQKMSQSMMELYKKEKVNPMGGCLPILVQMPVFISLYWVLLESVELRQAEWLGWINDLSQMDPYFVLPLIMGVSMFAQQLLNPTPPDPLQAKVMKFMPVIFTFFFLWFPAGLVLYWVTNNILSFIQQYIITKKIEQGDNLKKN